MLDKVRILTQNLVIVGLMEPKTHMPDILSSHYQGRHVPFILDLLTKLNEFIVGGRLCPAIFIEICFVVYDTLCIFTGHGSRIDLSGKSSCCLE